MATRDCPRRRSKTAASSLIKRVTGAEQKEEARTPAKVIADVKQVSTTIKHVGTRSAHKKLNPASINKIATPPRASNSQQSPIRDSQSDSSASKIQICHVATRSKDSSCNQLVKDGHALNNPTQSIKENDSCIVQPLSDVVQIKKVDVVQIEKIEMPSISSEIDDIKFEKHLVSVPAAQSPMIKNCRSRIGKIRLNTICATKSKCVAVKDSSKCDLDYHSLVSIDPVKSPRTAIENGQRISDSFPTSPVSLDCRLASSNCIKGMIQKDKYDLSQPACSESLPNAEEKSAELYNNCERVSPRVDELAVEAARETIDSPKRVSPRVDELAVEAACGPIDSPERVSPRVDELAVEAAREPIDSPERVSPRVDELAVEAAREPINSPERVSPRVDELAVKAAREPIDSPASLDVPDCSSISDPCDVLKSEFLAQLGLLSITELWRLEADTANSRLFRDHRHAGGRLRRNVKYSRAPGMVYASTRRSANVSVGTNCSTVNASGDTNRSVVKSSRGTNRTAINASGGGSSAVTVNKLKSTIRRKKENETKLQLLPTHQTGCEPSERTSACGEESNDSRALLIENEEQAFTHPKLSTDSSGLMLHKEEHVAVKVLCKDEESQFSSQSSSSSSMSSTAQSKVAVKRKRYVVDTSAEPRRSSRHEGEERRAWGHLLRAKPDTHFSCSTEDTKSPVKSNGEELLQDQKSSKVKGTRAEDCPQLKRSETIEPVSSEHVVALKKSKSCTNALPTVVEKHNTRLPNILSKPVPKIIPKLVTSSPIKCVNTVIQCDLIKEEEAVVSDSQAVPDVSGEQDDEVLNQDVFMPVDQSILNYRYNEMCCIIPHMCSVCWRNDHMYAANMKRLPRDLPAFGGCIHFISCHHFRPVHRDISQLGVLEPNVLDVGGNHPFRWRFVERNKNMHCNSLTTPEVRREFKGREEDLYCDEEMFTSDLDSPRHGRENSMGGRVFETSGGAVEVLHRQLQIRRHQIIRSVGRVPGNTPPKNLGAGDVTAGDAVQDYKMANKDKQSNDEVDSSNEHVEVEDYGATEDISTTDLPTYCSSKREVNKGHVNLHKVRNLLAASETDRPIRMARLVTGEMRPTTVIQEYPPGVSLIPRPVVWMS